MHSVRDMEANAARYAALSPEEKAKADRELLDHRRSLIVGEIAAERQRQIEREGYDPSHDDRYTWGALAYAGASYAMSGGGSDAYRERYGDDDPPATWPWLPRFWHPKDRRSDLIRAAALILAEIERLDRAGGPQ